MNKNNLILLLLLLLGGKTFSQSNINPDISLIGTFDAFTNFIKGTPEYEKLNFDDPEMELFIDGYLNPYAKAAANLSYENNQMGVEELYGNIVNGLPLDMQIKAGKFLVGFGKLNTVHPHAWPFLERPLFHQVFFGQNGFNDVGVNFSFALPTGDLFTGLDLGLFKGKSITPLTDVNYVDRGVNPLFVGRLNTFIPIDDYTNLEVGLSGSYGAYAKGNLVYSSPPENNGSVNTFYYNYYGVDFKFKYSPNAYSVLTIQGEGLLDNRSVPRFEQFVGQWTTESSQNISNCGAFIYADYKFDKQYSFGVKYDYTAGIINDAPTFNTLANDDKNSTQGIEAWIGYYPAEETTVVRLGFQHLSFNYANGYSRDGETTLKLQFIFSLGPHKAHPF